MSQVKIQGNASGTGVFTVAAPNSNTDRTLTLPDTTGTVALTSDIPTGYTDADALDLFSASGSAPVYACRAWVNFNGTGTVAIRGSGNVSSITDNGNGDYTINFTTAMPDENYSTSLVTRKNAVSGWYATALIDASVAPTSSACRVVNAGATGAQGDIDIYNAAVFR